MLDKIGGAPGGFRSGWRRRASTAPADELLVAENFFLPLQPQRHLKVLVLPIGGAVRILREIDVEPLRMLRIIVVESSKELDMQGIVRNIV